MIYDDYAEYTRKYKDLYGPRTVVLMEVGSFWELYDCNENKGADITYICSLLNIVCSKKNKNIEEVSVNNPRMAGFPSHALGKFLPILVEDNFTIVLVGQVTAPPNPKRAVTDIISKATFIPDAMDTKQDKNILLAIYIDSCTCPIKKLQTLLSGVAVINIATGKILTYELHNANKDSTYTFHDIYSLVKKWQPSEVIVYKTAKIQEQEFLQESGLASHPGLHILGTFYDKDIHDINYQNYIFKHAFCLKTALMPIEELHLERNQQAVIALTMGLRYCLDHNPLLISKLQLPEHQHDETELSLSYNCFEQLDIPILIKTLNKCVTPHGRRYFTQRLSHPFANEKEITTSQEIINQVFSKFEATKELDKIHQTLSGVQVDFYKFLRRCATSKVQPYEISALHDSITKLQYLFKHHKSLLEFDCFGKPLSTLEHCNFIAEYIQSRIDLEKCSSTSVDNISAGIFKPGVFSEIDDLQAKYTNILTHWRNLVSMWNSQIPGTNVNHYKLEQNDRDGFYISVTNKRYIDTKQQLSGICDAFASLHTLGGASGQLNRLTSHELQSDSRQAEDILKQLNGLTIELYDEFVNILHTNYVAAINNVASYVEQIDFYITVLLMSQKYNYVLPKISPSSSCSFLACEGLRHPLVEITRDEAPYVANDIFLDNENTGMLLYGLNSAGKSTLMKSLAISVIMAQAGMPVPCKSMTLCPFKSIFSRITKGDDLLGGKSTFVVEMSELRNILLRADSQSLVIGDELCSGTETASALAIVAAGIQELMHKKTKFIFATHLHELCQLKDIRHNVNILVKHIHVDLNEDGKLVYHRLLQEGPGSGLYGVEVCKALGLPDHVTPCQMNFATPLIH